MLYGFLGVNGAGKTTTLRMISGLLRPDAGTIRVCGIDAVAEPLRAKQPLAYIPDDPVLYGRLNPMEHLEFVARALERCARRGARARAGSSRAPGPVGPPARVDRVLLARHEAEGCAGQRAHPRAAAHPAR